MMPLVELGESLVWAELLSVGLGMERAAEWALARVVVPWLVVP